MTNSLVKMSNREEIEKPRLNWKEKYQEFYAKTKSPSVQYFLDILDKNDKFIPDCINKMRQSDLTRLLNLSVEVQKLARKNSYNFFFLHLINKAIILLLEQFPELFDQLTDKQKETVLGIKLDLPTEIDVYQNVYAYLWGRHPMPAGTLNTGLPFKTLLERIASENPELLDRELLESLCSMHNQYQIYLKKIKIKT